METADVAPALQECLGPEATTGLLELLNHAREEWADEVTTTAIDRFEHRLMTECGRIERRLADVESGFRLALTQSEAALRGEMRTLEINLRKDFGDLRQEVAAGRFELLKWSFAFWVGQMIAMAGIIGVMLRVMLP